MCEATLRAIDGFTEGDQFEEKDMGHFMNPSNRTLAFLGVVVLIIFLVYLPLALASH